MKLLNEKQVAQELGCSIGLLRKWRANGQGPKFLRLSRLVRYVAEDVWAWLESRPSGGEHQAE